MWCKRALEECDHFKYLEALSVVDDEVSYHEVLIASANAGAS